MATDNHLEKLTRVIDSLQLPPGSLTHVIVLHDDRCQFLRGGHCNCDPTLNVLRDREKSH
jgi:hypothetical protein